MNKINDVSSVYYPFVLVVTWSKTKVQGKERHLIHLIGDYSSPPKDYWLCSLGQINWYIFKSISTSIKYEYLTLIKSMFSS